MHLINVQLHALYCYKSSTAWALNKTTEMNDYQGVIEHGDFLIILDMGFCKKNWTGTILVYETVKVLVTNVSGKCLVGWCFINDILLSRLKIPL